MAIAGAWAAGSVTPSEYAGALRWGTGINPIHGVRDGDGRPTGTKLALVPGDPQTDAVPEEILGPAMWGYSAEDASFYAGEDYRYLVDDHPNWGQEEHGRADRDGDIMTEGRYPQPDGWPSWGPHEVPPEYADAQFPLGGPPGGAQLRSYTDGTDVEKLRAIAVPTPGWRGGWMNKAHGQVQEAEPAADGQLTVTTSMTQLHQTRVNTAAVTRGTDDARAPIETRLTGQKVKHYAESFGMGGGPGTPDMRQQPQDLPYRPWFFRQAAAPPPPNTFFGTMSANQPIARTLPADAGESVVTSEAADSGDDSFGYTEGDYFG